MMDRAPSADVPHPLQLIRSLIASPADRVRWACVLEAIAPKAGNVHPSASFADLTVGDFLAAAEAIAPVIGTAEPAGLGEMVLRSIRATAAACRSNVNLGIVLLLAPLQLAAARQAAMAAVDALAAGRADPVDAMRQVLREVTPSDGAQVFEAIRLASPGGLGHSDTMDVNTPPPQVDLLEAMRHARQRDRVALQYASHFEDLFRNVVPLVDAAIRREGDVLRGICWAQIELLAAQADTLIVRKQGADVAEQARQRAAAVLAESAGEARQRAWQALDRWLRGDANHRNPGTTADLIAAALWVLLEPGRVERPTG